jgi:NAD(P)-dependent dehydrogenase (short-subunit alcohol dehydrogenase family)
VAERQAAQGARVVVVGRTGGKLEEVVTRIRRAGGTADAVVADLRHARQATAAVEAARALVGSIRLLIHSAGIYREGPFAEMTDAMADDLIDVNLKAVVFTIRAALPALEDGAAIINIASTSGVRPLNDAQSLYAATKAAVIHLGSCLARELAPRRIRVCTVSPGPIRTPILKTVAPDEMIPEIQAALARQVPLRRIGEPDEVAEAVVYLASAPFATGAHVVLDGGTAL